VGISVYNPGFRNSDWEPIHLTNIIAEMRLCTVWRTRLVMVVSIACVVCRKIAVRVRLTTGHAVKIYA
jgi:hypothetical protein